MIKLNIINLLFIPYCESLSPGYFIRQREVNLKTLKQTWEDTMGGYESLAWIKDKNGKEYVCPIDVLKGDTGDRFELTPEEQQACMDVNQIIGTERW